MKQHNLILTNNDSETLESVFSGIHSKSQRVAYALQQWADDRGIVWDGYQYKRAPYELIAPEFYDNGKDSNILIDWQTKLARQGLDITILALKRGCERWRLREFERTNLKKNLDTS